MTPFQPQTHSSSSTVSQSRATAGFPSTLIDGQHFDLWESKLTQARLDMDTSTALASKDSQNESYISVYSQLQNHHTEIEWVLSATVQENHLDFTDYTADILSDEDSFIKNHVLYTVPQGIQAAAVDEYWDAAHTSDRIVNFAMSFRGQFPEKSDEEFIDMMRTAMLNGFANAKDTIGEVTDYPLAQLYNDTFTMSLNKMDQLLAQAKN